MHIATSWLLCGYFMLLWQKRLQRLFELLRILPVLGIRLHTVLPVDAVVQTEDPREDEPPELQVKVATQEVHEALPVGALDFKVVPRRTSARQRALRLSLPRYPARLPGLDEPVSDLAGELLGHRDDLDVRVSSFSSVPPDLERHRHGAVLGVARAQGGLVRFQFGHHVERVVRRDGQDRRVVRDGDDLSQRGGGGSSLTKTCPPPGTNDSVPWVGINCPFGSVTYVSDPIATIRCLVTFGLLRQNQPGVSVSHI